MSLKFETKLTGHDLHDAMPMPNRPYVRSKFEIAVGTIRTVYKST